MNGRDAIHRVYIYIRANQKNEQTVNKHYKSNDRAQFRRSRSVS